MSLPLASQEPPLQGPQLQRAGPRRVVHPCSTLRVDYHPMPFTNRQRKMREDNRPLTVPEPSFALTSLPYPPSILILEMSPYLCLNHRCPPACKWPFDGQEHPLSRCLSTWSLQASAWSQS